MCVCVCVRMCIMYRVSCMYMYVCVFIYACVIVAGRDVGQWLSISHRVKYTKRVNPAA